MLEDVSDSRMMKILLFTEVVSSSEAGPFSPKANETPGGMRGQGLVQPSETALTASCCSAPCRCQVNSRWDEPFGGLPAVVPPLGSRFPARVLVPGSGPCSRLGFPARPSRHCCASPGPVCAGRCRHLAAGAGAAARGARHGRGPQRREFLPLPEELRGKGGAGWPRDPREPSLSSCLRWFCV